MRVARLLSIVFEVDSRPGITAAALAAELGVSVRTLHRDVSALQQAGVPLYGAPGRGGGLRLVEGYRSRAAALRSDEAAALLAGVVPGVAEQLGFEADAQRARRKVTTQTGGATTRLAETQIVVDPVGWYRAAREAPHLRLVADALRSRRAIDVVYRRWQEPAEVDRRLEPHGLVLKAGTWYVMARSSGAIRTYRVDQIASASLTDESFEPDSGFDLAAAWAAFVSSFHERMRVIDVDVRTTRAGRDRIRREGDALLGAALDEVLAGSPDDEGERVVTLPFESAERAAAELVRFGDGVEALGPPEVRARVVAIVAALADRYGRATV